MTPTELLQHIRQRGFTLKADGKRILVAPAGRVTPALREAVKTHREELLALLRPARVSVAGETLTRPAPPAGVRLFFGRGDDGRPCAPEEAHHWTYEGAPRWFYASENPPPAHEMVLWAGYRKRCRHCVGRRLRLAWQEFANGTKHLRCECASCGRYVAHVSTPPGNPDIEYRAT